MDRGRQGFRVALVQHPPVFLNLEATVQRAVSILAEAASEGADVVVFPETWLPGYPVWIDSAPGAALWDHAPAKALYRLLRRNAPTLDGPEVRRLRAAASEVGVVAVVGIHERRGGTLYNTVLLIDGPGDGLRIHRKLMPTYTERMMWGQGDGSTLRALDTDRGTVGALICWEHWMPLARAAMHGQDELLHVAQWPSVHELHLLASRQYAFEGQCWVAASGCAMTRGDVLEGFDSLSVDEPEARDLLASIPGDDDAGLLTGGSVLIAPDASLRAGPAGREATVVHGEVDPAAVDEGSLILDTAGHYSRPDVLRLEVDTTPRIDADPLAD